VIVQAGIIWVSLASAQPPLELIEQVHQRSARIEQVGMLTPGSWALPNLGAGVAGSLVAEDPTRRAFPHGTARWNSVHLAIAVPG